MHDLLLENEMASFLCCHLMACQEQQISRVKSGVRTPSQGREKKKDASSLLSGVQEANLLGGEVVVLLKIA